jgi:ankyrin repeat protein
MDPKEKKRTLPLSQVDLSYSAPFVVRMTENKYYARSYDDVPPPVMSMFAEHEPSLRANQARSVDRGRQYMPPLSSYLNPQIEETVKENPLTSTQQLDRRRRHDTTRLYNALLKCDTTVLTQMLKEGYNMSEIVFAVPKLPSDLLAEQYTSLEFVVFKNDLVLARFLLEKGVNPNVEGPNGDTPLIISIKAEFLQMCESLLVAGANTCKPDTNGKTPLYWAVDKKNQKIINQLLDYGAEMTIHTALLHAIDLGYLDVVQLLVERGAPLNVVSSGTPLIRAIERSHSDITKYLIKKGADINLADKNGNLPLNLCMEKRNFEILNCMIANGLKVDATLASSLLVCSLEMEQVDTVEYFIKQGADVNQKNKNGQTLLSTALKNSDLRSFRLLIESGADPRLAEAEIKKKMAKDDDFAIYMNSLNLESKIKKVTIRENGAPKGESTENASSLQGATGHEEAPLHVNKHI